MNLFPYNQPQIKEYIEYKARKYCEEESWFENEIISQLHDHAISMIKAWRVHHK